MFKSSLTTVGEHRSLLPLACFADVLSIAQYPNQAHHAHGRTFPEKLGATSTQTRHLRRHLSNGTEKHHHRLVNLKNTFDQGGARRRITDLESLKSSLFTVSVFQQGCWLCSVTNPRTCSSPAPPNGEQINGSNLVAPQRRNLAEKKQEQVQFRLRSSSQGKEEDEDDEVTK